MVAGTNHHPLIEVERVAGDENKLLALVTVDQLKELSFLGDFSSRSRK